MTHRSAMDSERRNTTPESSVAIVALTRAGGELALELASRFEGSDCFLPAWHGMQGCRSFDRLGDLLPGIWESYDGIVCIMAAGIVVRLIAPLLSHKTVDPAVVVVDENGEYAVSLVSGHLGGANLLAKKVAEKVGGRAVITTASDVRGKPAVDMVAVQEGFDIENIGMVKQISRAVLEDEATWIYDPGGRIRPFFESFPNVMCCPGSAPSKEESPGICRSVRRGNSIDSAPVSSPDWAGQTMEEHRFIRSVPGVWASERLAPRRVRCLKLRPRNLVIGVGCNRSTASDEIVGLIRKVFLKFGLSLLSVRNLASVDLKADEQGIIEAAEILNRPIYFYSRDEAGKISVPNPSDMVGKHIGVQSVCEATAKLSARADEILVPKQKTANATVAVARVSSP